MPFQNVPSPMPPQTTNIMGPLMAMMLQKKMSQTPANTIDPSQMMQMGGQNQIPMGPQSSQSMPNGQGMMSPQQFMQAGYGSSPTGG